MPKSEGITTMTRAAANRMTKEMVRSHAGLASRWCSKNTDKPVDRKGTFEVERRKKKKMRHKSP